MVDTKHDPFSKNTQKTQQNQYNQYNSPNLSNWNSFGIVTSLFVLLGIMFLVQYIRIIPLFAMMLFTSFIYVYFINVYFHNMVKSQVVYLYQNSKKHVFIGFSAIILFSFICFTTFTIYEIFIYSAFILILLINLIKSYKK